MDAIKIAARLLRNRPYEESNALDDAIVEAAACIRWQRESLKACEEVNAERQRRIIELEKVMDLMNRKHAHKCTDGRCPECDD